MIPTSNFPLTEVAPSRSEALIVIPVIHLIYISRILYRLVTVLILLITWTLSSSAAASHIDPAIHGVTLCL